jgi:hypothetical protein
MNADHDPQVIARVRAALDEVAATHAVAVGAPHRPAMSARRWLAAAASVVLVAGAITAIAVNLSNRHSVTPAGSGGPGGSDETAPPSSSNTTSATLPYFLAAADLAPGPVGADPCCLSEGESVIAWALGGDVSQGLLILHGGYPQEGTPATSTPSASNVLIDGTALIIDSYGITAEERDALAAQIVPGSGLPWVLPVDGWEWMGMETGADRALWYHQTFGGTVCWTPTSAPASCWKSPPPRTCGRCRWPVNRDGPPPMVLMAGRRLCSGAILPTERGCA